MLHKNIASESLAFLFFVLFTTFSCTSLHVGSSNEGEDALEEEYEGDPYPFNSEAVKAARNTQREKHTNLMYADAFALHSYEGQDTLYWVNRYGLSKVADTLLIWLHDIELQGICRKTLCLDVLDEDVKALKAILPNDATEEQVTPLLGRIEANMMTAYFRYVYGQYYGYIKAPAVFNASIGRQSDTLRTCHHLFATNYETPTDSLGKVALKKVFQKGEFEAFMEDIQPNHVAYSALRKEYDRAVKAKEQERIDLARINLERCRWRYPHPTSTAKGKYIFVNLPAFWLTAVDNTLKKNLEMKVCCGTPYTRTPLFSTAITYVEMNPAWIVPPSIVRGDIARHAHSSRYFSACGYFALNGRGDTINAATLSASQLCSGRYAIVQRRGKGNALGRLLFRFPNDYAIYLHDTNSPGAFDLDVRAVSHGCVRLQKPFELADFLVNGDGKNALLSDKIRVAIEKDPITEDGKHYKAVTDSLKRLDKHTFKPSVPLFIDYFTLYPDTKGELHSYADIYGYDKHLLQLMAGL